MPCYVHWVCPAHALIIAQRFLGKPATGRYQLFLKVLVWDSLQKSKPCVQWADRTFSHARQIAAGRLQHLSTTFSFNRNLVSCGAVTVDFVRVQDFFPKLVQGKPHSLFLLLYRLAFLQIFRETPAKKKLNRKRDDGMVNRLPRDWRDNGQVVEREIRVLA